MEINVTFKAFAALARKRSWTVQSLAARFRGRIQNPAEFFNRILDAKSPDNLVPYRSVIEFYAESQTKPAEAARPTCACGCGRAVFDRKKWATPGCRTKAQRKKVQNEQKWLGQLIDFVKPRLRQNRRTGTLPLTERRVALRAD
jgi:hypothetical protein